MMAGFPPFEGENDAEVLASIVSVNFSFPTPEWDDYSEDAKNFISLILVEDPEKRLTAQQVRLTTF
jgi:serine/threonine protein kinase